MFSICIFILEMERKKRERILSRKSAYIYIYKYI